MKVVAIIAEKVSKLLTRYVFCIYAVLHVYTLMNHRPFYCLVNAYIPKITNKQNTVLFLKFIFSFIVEYANFFCLIRK